MTPAELKEIRKGLGLPQAAVAKGLGLSLRAYEEIEAGRAVFRDIHLNALVGYLLRFGFPVGHTMPEMFLQYLTRAATVYEAEIKERRREL